MEVLNFITLSKNSVNILPCWRLSLGLVHQLIRLSWFLNLREKILGMHSFQRQFLCPSWKGHFILQAEYEMVNSGTKPIFKLYGETCYKHLFLRQSNFGNNHWFKDARDHIFSSKTNQWMLTLSVTEKLKNSILEMPIITQTLNINNLRTTSATSINLHIIRKLVEYSLKNVWHR